MGMVVRYREGFGNQALRVQQLQRSPPLLPQPQVQRCRNVIVVRLAGTVLGRPAI